MLLSLVCHTKDAYELSLTDISLVFVVAVLKLLKMATGMRALLDTVVQALPQVKHLPKSLSSSVPFSKGLILVEFQGWCLLWCAGNCLKVMSIFSCHSWGYSSPRISLLQHVKEMRLEPLEKDRFLPIMSS